MQTYANPEKHAGCSLVPNVASAHFCCASDLRANAPPRVTTKWMCRTHQENRKALVGLATRPNQSQTRANKTRPDRQDDQTARGPLCLKPEVAHNVPFIINLHLNLQFFSNQNNKTKPEHQSLPVFLMPLSSTFITKLEDMVEDKPNLYAAPAINKDELYVHNDAMQQVYANTTKGSYTRNSTKPPFAKQDGVHTPTSQKPPSPC
jgi:hypothetical protein